MLNTLSPEAAFNELAGDTMDLLQEALGQLKKHDTEAAEDIARRAVALCMRGAVLCMTYSQE